MVQAIERIATSTTVFDVVANDGPLTTSEIAERLSISTAAAVVYARELVSSGFFDRDESGRYANYCYWPRFGL